MEGVVAGMPTSRLQRYAGARVLLTGHSGFKGTWLSSWLADLGAEVVGFSLPARDDPTNVVSSTDIGGRISERFGDVRDAEAISTVLTDERPDLVIHMAAQSLVRRSYVDPVATMETNLMGTVNVLDAARRSDSVRAVISVASDKCYENREDGRAYVETDPLGGSDPYSASKGAAEIATASYLRSFFGDDSGKLLASVRAGNVLGAGDMSEDRIVPDTVRAIQADDRIVLRNPRAIRPWQHVLEPLRAYLLLGSYLLEGDRSKTGSWNIGPRAGDTATVEELVRLIVESWGTDTDIVAIDDGGPHEAQLLHLDTSKVQRELGFEPVLRLSDTARYVADGYRAHLDGEPLGSVLRRQTASYMELI